jgi:hypothetical protein
MRVEEVFDRLALVSREVVGDHMDLFAARLIDHDVGQEGDELRGGVPLSGLAQHLASLYRAGSIRSHVVRPCPGRAAVRDPCGPGLEWPSFNRRKTLRRAPALAGNVDKLFDVLPAKGHVLSGPV